MEQIIVRISKDGSTTVKTEGFTGRSCHEASAAIERALGVTVHDVETEEAFENADADAEIKL